MSDDGQTKFTLRMSDDLHQKVADAAALAGRSLNSELVHRIEQSFQAADLTIVVGVLTKLAARLSTIENSVSDLHIHLMPEEVLRPLDAAREMAEAMEKYTGEPITTDNLKIISEITRKMGVVKKSFISNFARRFVEQSRGGVRIDRNDFEDIVAGASLPDEAKKRLTNKLAISRAASNQTADIKSPEKVTIKDIDRMVSEGLKEIVDEAQRDPDFAVALGFRPHLPVPTVEPEVSEANREVAPTDTPPRSSGGALRQPSPGVDRVNADSPRPPPARKPKKT